MASNARPATTFPCTQKVTLELEVECSSPEDLDYLQTQDQGINPGFIADVFDVLRLNLVIADIKKINGLTKEDLQRLFDENLDI